VDATLDEQISMLVRESEGKGEEVSKLLSNFDKILVLRLGVRVTGNGR
jgi:hypothetical protein